MKKFVIPLNVVLALSLLAAACVLAACGSTAEPQIVVETVVVETEKEVIETVEVEKEVTVIETVEVEKEVTVIETVEVEAPAQEICMSGAFVGDPDKIGGFVEAFGQLVSERLECGVQFDTLPEGETVRSSMEAGDLDIALVNASDYLLLDDALGIVPLFIPAYEVGGAFYRGAFIVRADSGIEALSDFEGKTIAYTTQESLYGYLLPRAFLSEQGYNPDDLFQEMLFVGPSAGDVTRAVYDGEADVGVIWAHETGDARQLIAHEIQDVWDMVQIIDYTPEIPFDIIAIQPNVPDGLQEQLQSAMRQVSMDDKGQEALYGIYEIVELVDPDDRFWEAVDWLRYAQELPEVLLTLTVLKGTVEVNGETVTEEAEVREGDEITTGPNGFARLVFFADEGIHTELKPVTKMLVEELAPGEIRLFLFEGTMRSTLEPGRKVRFVVAAEAAEIEASGTVLIIEVDAAGDLVVAVLEGRVIARAPDGHETEVSGRQQLTIPLDRPFGLPESTIFVGFDTSLDDYELEREKQEQPDTLTGRYSALRTELSAEGYFPEEVVAIEDNGHYDVLIGLYDVLIILDPEHDLAVDNIRVIHEWVEEGHGLFVVGERRWFFAQSSINELLAPYGVAFTEEDPGDSKVADSFISHDITQGVNRLRLDVSGALQGGIELGYADSGHLVLSAYENAGRVLVLADSTSLTNRHWGTHDVATFILNAIKWLAEAR